MITGVAIRTFEGWRALVKKGEEPSQAGRKVGYRSPKREAARSFLQHFASMHDYSPNETSKANGLTVVSAMILPILMLFCTCSNGPFHCTARYVLMWATSVTCTIYTPPSWCGAVLLIQTTS